MSTDTSIEWTDATLSPWINCSPVSAGCAHCYVPTTAPARVHGVKLGGPRLRVKTFRAQALALNRKAERVGRRLRVFPSLCDWLDAEVPVEWLADFLDVVRLTPALDWQLLTKRPALWKQQLKAALAVVPMFGELAAWILNWMGGGRPPANVWIGTSIEHQRAADERVPALLTIPAVVRFISLEPLLEAVSLLSDPLLDAYPGAISDSIHWGIVGGESGPEARPCVCEHVLDLVYQFRSARVPLFAKQLGSCPVTTNANAMEWPDDATFVDFGSGAASARVMLRSRKGGDMEEWPEELRVREFPEARS